MYVLQWFSFCSCLFLKGEEGIEASCIRAHLAADMICKYIRIYNWNLGWVSPLAGR